jgi:AcrR family transcriptional regulator
VSAAAPAAPAAPADPAPDCGSTELLWARRTGPRRPRLTREAIVDAAITIADAEGIEAVSIRRVANALGARPMSLYSHFDRKDDLLALMNDQVAAEILVPEPLPADWRDALRAIAHRTRESCLRHPWVLQTYVVHPRLGPNALRHTEQSTAAVASLPLPLPRRIALLRAVDTYTLGQVAAELHERETRSRVGLAEVRDYLADVLATGQYPHLAQLPPEEVIMFVSDPRATFVEGLDWLLAGVASTIRAKTP